MILAASFVWICCWWCNIIQWYSVSAFHHCNLGGTNQRRLYNKNEDKKLISSSCVVLFAKGSGGQKKKKKKNKSKSQTKKENLFLRSDGGKGFGIPRATATVNAPVSNEEDKGRAIKVEPETQQRQPQRMTSNSVRARKQRIQKWGQRQEENIETATTITTKTTPFGDGNEAKIENKHNIINNDDDEDEDEEVIQQWIERCRGEFLDFELRKLIPSPKRLVQVSEDPLIFTVDEFLDPALCARVRSNGSGCFNLMYPERLSDTLFDGQESEMDGLLFNVATSREHASATTTTKKKKNQHDQMHYYPHGLHMDTNNQCLERHVTAILYLNDVPTECGGATVFPIARASPHDPALKASERLLQHQIDHTHSPALLDDPNLQADAALLESRVGSNFGESPHNETAIKIQPKAGRLLVFFSRRNDGTQDPRAWHAGARLLDATNDGNEATTNTTEKRILTLFKQVDYGDGSTTTATTTATTTTTTTTSRSMKNNLDAYLAPQVEEQRLLLQRKARPKTQS